MKTKRSIAYFMSIILLISITLTGGVFASNEPTTFNVMAPLKVTNWSQFDSNLALAKDMGVEAVSVDVWWGDVEKNQDNQFDWSYYDTIFNKIKTADLKIVAIMSFHQCGGNVGDDYTSVLPTWVWSKYEGTQLETLTLSVGDLKYKSELGNESPEYLALWTDPMVSNEYIDFMNAFESHYGTMNQDFMELNISCGPAGELRYPSYNSHDDFNYPERGRLQSYSRLAIKNFQEDMITKYGTLDGVNQAWGLNMTAVNDIQPPSDGSFFFSDTSHYLSAYGKDYINWYNGQLVEHGDRMLTYGEQAFNGQFADVPIGIKIPGVHWQMTGSRPRIAEMSAGLINSTFDSDANGHGYNPITSMIKTHSDAILHFTCLEMDNKSSESSLAKDLVFWVAKSAENQGLVIKGENALSGGNDNQSYWNNIDNAMTWASYKGLTVLRMNDVVHGDSNGYYRQLIQKFKGVEGVQFTVHNAYTTYGENVYIVGGHTSLGNWNTDNAILLDSSNYPTWSTTIEGLPTDQHIEFKFIKKNGSQVIWQSGNNNTLNSSTFEMNW